MQTIPRKHRPLFLALSLLLSLAICLLPAVVQADSPPIADARYLHLTILSTTDFHAALLSADIDKATGKPYGGVAVVAAYINKLRAANPDGTLVLDAGDAMQGGMTSNLFFGRPIIECMNAAGYDAMTIGNHEFDWGVDKLRERIAEARFPVLSANIFEKSTGRRPPWAAPYAVFARNGVKIGVIGVTTVETSYVVLPAHVKELEFRAPAPIVNGLAAELRDNGVAVVVVLAHEGGVMGADGAITGPLADLAQAVTGVDAVFGGHSHTAIAGKIKGLPVVAAYYGGRALGRIELDYDPIAKRVFRSEQDLLKTFADATAPDPRVAAIVDKYETIVGPLKNEVIGRAAVDLARDYNGESNLGNLVADVMRAAARTDFAFTNAGGLRADLAAGAITVGQVYEVIPFDNTLVTMKLTGAQIKEVLETGASLAKGMVQVSGLRFVHDPRQPAGRRVIALTRPDGKPIEPGKTYTVATNDFMATGGDNFTVFLRGAEVTDTHLLLREALIAWFKAETAAGRAAAPRVEGRVTRMAAAAAG